MLNVIALDAESLITLADGGNADAKAEITRRAEKKQKAGKRITKALAHWLGVDPKTGEPVEADAKPAAKPAKAEPKATAKAQPVRLFSGLKGLERHRALKAKARELGLTASGSSDSLEAAIVAAGVEAPEPATKAEPKAAPKGKPATDTGDIVARVQAMADEVVSLRAENARLRAEAAAGGNDGSVAAIDKILAALDF